MENQCPPEYKAIFNNQRCLVQNIKANFSDIISGLREKELIAQGQYDSLQSSQDAKEVFDNCILLNIKMAGAYGGSAVSAYHEVMSVLQSGASRYFKKFIEKIETERRELYRKLLCPVAGPNVDPSRQYQVFISYGREEATNEMVDTIKKHLEQQNSVHINVFVDRKNIEPGNHWPTEVVSAIHTSPVFIAVLTKKYVSSHYCHGELYEAQALGKSLFPVVLENGWDQEIAGKPVREILGEIQDISLQPEEDIEGNLALLIKSIVTKLGGGPVVTDQSSTVATPSLPTGPVVIDQPSTVDGPSLHTGGGPVVTDKPPTHNITAVTTDDSGQSTGISYSAGLQGQYKKLQESCQYVRTPACKQIVQEEVQPPIQQHHESSKIEHLHSVPSIASGFKCPCSKCTIDGYLSNRGCPRNKSKSLFPFLRTPALNNDERSELEGHLEVDTREMMNCFASFTHQIKISLENHLPLTRVKDFVLSLEAVDAKDEEEIRSDSNIDEVFMVLRKYISFFNYNIIEQLILNLGSADDQKKLQEYLEALEKFCKRNVFEVPHDIFSCSKSRRDAEVFILKCTEKRITTLKDVQVVKRRIASKLGLQSSSLQLCSIREGCLELCFLISSIVADRIFPISAATQSDLREIGVESFSCETIRRETDEKDFKLKEEWEDGKLSVQPLDKMAEKIISDQQSSKGTTHLATPIRDTDINVGAKKASTQKQSYATVDEIQQQVEVFEQRFAVLSFELQEELKKKIEEGEEKLSKVKQSINLLPHEIKSEHDRFLKMIIKEKVLKDFKDVDDAFFHLNTYWSYFDYSLLQHLINKFASNELQHYMYQYNEDMKMFREKTPVSACSVEAWEMDIDDLPSGAEEKFVTVRAVLKKDPSQCTLKELHRLRKDYCSAYHLSECALMLSSIRFNAGYIFIKWRLPVQLVRELMSTIKNVPVEVFCITRNITLMYVGRRKVYDDIVFEETKVEGQESLCDLLDRRGSECSNQKDEHPYTDALLPGPLQYLESDDDEQLIISLRFKTTVRLHSLQLTGPLNGRAPKTVRLFVNQPEPLCFESAQNRVALQEFVLTDENVRDDAVMTLNYLKFQNVMSLTIFVEDNQGNKETTVIHHIGLFGSPVEYLNMAHFKRVSGVEGERHIHEWEYSSCGRNP